MTPKNWYFFHANAHFFDPLQGRKLAWSGSGMLSATPIPRDRIEAGDDCGWMKAFHAEVTKIAISHVEAELAMRGAKIALGVSPAIPESQRRISPSDLRVEIVSLNRVE